MKILTAVAFALSMSAQATDYTQTCVEIGELAKIIMDRRQDGIEIAKMLELANKQESDYVSKLTKSIIIEAYKVSRYSTFDYKQRAIEEFTNSTVVACLQSYS